MRAGYLASCLAAAVMFPQAGSAQAPREQVRISARTADGEPIAGALVALIDHSGRTIAEGLSGSAGTHTLTVPAGTYRARVRRVGFKPYLSAPFTVPRPGGLQLTIAPERVLLATMRVTARDQCRRVDQDSETLGTLWEEISKALRASQLTRDDLTEIPWAMFYRREVEGRSVIAHDSTVVKTWGRPFVAADPAVLAEKGYVLGDVKQGWDFYGPDETVLLSDEFAATHCFSVVRERDRPGDIGVRFTPVRGRRIPDIAGVLWVDEQSAELREIQFQFVNTGVLARFDAGGSTRFRRMPSGAWLVDEWKLRMPKLELQLEPYSPLEVGHIEYGGAIAFAGPAAAVEGGTATVRGTVVDGPEQKPLSGAVVRIAGASAVTDAEGMFELTGVPTGAGTIAFSHPRLFDFGFIVEQRPIGISGDTTGIVLSTPTMTDVWSRMCRDSVPNVPVLERGVVHGYVRDSAGGPVHNATVEFRWTPYAALPGEAISVARMSLTVTTDSGGYYSACGFRRLSQGTVTATSETSASDRSAFSFDRSLIVRRDLTLRGSGTAPGMR